jgi:hypothetical protein
VAVTEYPSSPKTRAILKDGPCFFIPLPEQNNSSCPFGASQQYGFRQPELVSGSYPEIHNPNHRILK